ncbi:hypothetical protein BDV11DRAFT_76310 [Aspergillus similis]
MLEDDRPYIALVATGKSRRYRYQSRQMSWSMFSFLKLLYASLSCRLTAVLLVGSFTAYKDIV